MKISVITPSYNQAAFIEQTIKSVLEQDYKDIEFIIIDGGSTDGTIEILKKYDNHIKWVSEKDDGQSDAINKGFKMATGDILCWICSDDYFLPGAFQKIVGFFKNNPEKKWFTGDTIYVDEEDNLIFNFVSKYKRIWWKFPSYNALLILNYIPQQSTFWKKELMEEYGYLDQNSVYQMDYDLWLRFFKKYPPTFVKEKLASYRIHKKSKSGSQYRNMLNSDMQIFDKYSKNKFLKFIKFLHNKLVIFIYDIIK